MVKFDMGAAWDDAMTLVRAHLPLTVVLAGLFFFLPSVSAALLRPAPLSPPHNATPHQLCALLCVHILPLLPLLAAVMLSSTLVSIALLLLCLSRSSSSFFFSLR